MAESRQRRELQDQAYAAYTRLNRAIQTDDPTLREELLEECETKVRYVVKGLRLLLDDEAGSAGVFPNIFDRIALKEFEGSGEAQR